jgi:hypothetical protein
VTTPPQGRGLVEIGEDTGSDKLTHGYLPFYEDLFEPMRGRPVRLLEIGVGGFQQPDDPTYGGHSLRMWRAYFPYGHVVGLDILDKSGVADDRISIVQGSQVDAALLGQISAEFGPFDIIIDDGSHIPAHARFSFNVLFPLLAKKGSPDPCVGGLRVGGPAGPG